MGAYVTGGIACDACPPDVLLADGSVLFAQAQPPQIFDPSSETFSVTGRVVSPFHTAATLLRNGNVLLTGGVSDVTGRFAGAELYNPVTGTFLSASDMRSARVWHSSNLLPDGSVLIAGGDTDNCSGSECFFAGSVASAELYDPGTGLFTPTASMTTPRSLQRATVLRDGRVLMTGGVSYGGLGIFYGALASAELYTPARQNSAPLHFIPVPPCRVADTRSAEGPFGAPYLAGGASRVFVIANSTCGIPASALAYSLNLTVVPMTSLEYVTLWPTGEPQPLVSTLNSIDARVKANATIVSAGADTGVSVFATNDTHVILDINGYFVPASTTPSLAFFPLAPCRVADTRLPLGSLGQPYLTGGKARDFSITASNCNVPTSAQAYSLNFTVVPKGPSLEYLATWPAGRSQPLVSTLNDPTGTIVANAAIVPAGANGDISVFATHDTEVTIDINGYFALPQTGGLSLYTLAPCRVMDTRNNTGQPFSGTLDVPALNGGACAVPPQAQAYVLNATVVPSTRLDFLTLWPDGLTQPNISTLNAVDGAITSNIAMLPTTNGSVNAFTTNPSHLIFDLFAYFAP